MVSEEVVVTEQYLSDNDESITKRGKKRKAARPSSLPRVMKVKLPRPSLAQRRNFTLGLNISPEPTLQGNLPSTAPTLAKGRKKASKYNPRAIQTTTANVLFEDEVKANPEYSQAISCRGRLFMGSNDHSNDSTRAQRLFFNLGQNLYLEKLPDKTGVGEGSLRLSLWSTNSIDKLQRVGARYSITLNFDAISQVKKEAEDIKMALSLTDNENFVGFCLSLGQMVFLTVDPDICSVNLRKWYKPSDTKNDPETDLRPSREGIRLNYEQFKRFVEFLESQLTTEFPSFDTHVFCCNRYDHVEALCDMCNVQGLLPIQREFKRLLDDW